MNLNGLKCIDENIDIDEYISFREEVKKNMEYPEWLGDFTKEDLIDMLDNGSKIWIFYKDDEMVSSMMFIPSTEKDMIKFGLDLESGYVIDYGPMMVNKKYIGNHLQYQMLKYLDDYSKNIGYKYALGTIHPDNTFSINNLIKDNFKLVGQKEFRRGIRNIYLKEL